MLIRGYKEPSNTLASVRANKRIFSKDPAALYMTKAADRLFITQSALSQQLKDIEEKLQIDLFFRTRKKMLLTPVGQKLLQSAEKIVGLLDEAELEIAKLAGGQRGELKVGTQCIFCFKWLPQLLRTFQAEFPKIEFEIGTSYDLERELQEKKSNLWPLESALAFSPDGH